MIDFFWRITKTPTFVLNNRWKNVFVWPKQHVFFIPYYKFVNYDTHFYKTKEEYYTSLINLWINFLKRSHNKRVLYLHTAAIEYSKKELRILQKWKDEELWEIMIPVERLGRISIEKTLRV